MASSFSHSAVAIERQATVVNTASENNSPGVSSRQRVTIAYIGTLLFSTVYFFRPNDWLPWLGAFPIAKVAALVPILGLLIAILTGYRLRLGRQLWILLALFLQLAICVPFSTWAGGSFATVFYDFSKVTLFTVVLVQVLNAASRIRRMVFVQTAAVAAVAGISIFQGTREAGRMAGVGGLFGNPNDLAIGIAMTLPYALMFLLLKRNPAKRFFWLSLMLLMMAGIMATYSRTGFLSLLAVMLSVAWFFGIQGKNKTVLLAIFLLVLFAPVALTGKYLVRVESIFNASLDATGSADARQDLLLRSLKLAATHPLFGIGPGQFIVQSGNWHVAHNSFMEMFAEAGIAGGVLFIWLCVSAFNSLRKAVPDPSRHSRELQLLRAATLSSLFSFLVSACFASLEYEFFPYFLMAYCVSLATLLRKDQLGHQRAVVTHLPREVAACAE